MSDSKKTILFFDAIPMPHTLLMHELLEEEGYIVTFWFIKHLSNIYPWESLNPNRKFYVLGEKGGNLLTLLRQVLKSDLIITAGWYTNVHVLLIIISRLLNKTVAIWFDVPQKLDTNRKHNIKVQLTRVVNYIFVTGKTGMGFMEDWFRVNKAKIRDFPYLCAPVNEKRIAEINRDRESKIGSGDKIKIFVSNRFEERKGYHILLTALKSLDKDTLDQFVINIAGVGSKLKMNQNDFGQLNGNINFLKWLSYENYLKQMEESDVYIHASIHEPFGIPPIDAMARGKLVICSDGVYSSLDRIITGVNGYIYEKDKPDQLASYLKMIIKHKESIYSMGSQAMKVSRRYSFNYNLQTIKSVIGPAKS